MWFTEIALKRPVFTTMLNILIVVLGLIAFVRIGVDRQPRVDLPYVMVRVNVPGATPTFIEKNVVNPLENAIRPLEGVLNIDSTATIGSVTILVSFQLSEDINIAVNNLRNAVTGVTGKSSWPVTAMTPSVKPMNPNASPIFHLALSSKTSTMSPQDLSQYINDIFIPAIEQVQGVGQVDVSGLRLPEFDILFDNNKLNAMSSSAMDIINQIKLQIVAMPGGSVNNGKKFYNIDASTNPDSIESLANLPITLKNGDAIKLNQVAQVISTIQPQTTYGENNGLQALIVSVSKSSDANTVEVAKNLYQAVNQLKPTLHDKIELKIIKDSSKYISESMLAVCKDIIIGAILTIVIVYLFLQNGPATFISAISIPTSLIGTIAVITSLKFTLNPMTTIALSLSIGIIIDDSIVVIENIHRHLQLGKSAYMATKDAMKEIGIPAIAISLAIVAVFLPVAFMQGVTGRFFYEFGITISVSVLISLFVALTLTPCFGSRLLNPHVPTKKNIFFTTFDLGFSWLENSYQRVIYYTLQKPYKSIFVGFCIFLLGICLYKAIPTSFSNKEDEGSFSVNVQLNPNTDLPETIARTQEIESYVRTFPGIENVFFRTSGESSATMYINLVDTKQRNYSQKQIENRLRRDLKRFQKNKDEVITIGYPGKSQQPLQVILTHPKLDILNQYGLQLQDFIKTLEGTADVTSDTPQPAEQLKIKPNFIMANSLGVSSADLSNTLSNLFYGINVGTYDLGSDSYSIMAKLNPEQTREPQDILAVNIPSRNGRIVPINAVANMEKESSNSIIQHHNGIREYGVLSEYTGKDLGFVMKKISEFISKTAPVGLSFDFNGAAGSLKESNGIFIQALLFSFLFAYIVLCSQFESLLTPFVIILSVPLAFSGAFIFLILFRESMTLFAMVGFILLTGLVKKNAILLLDFAEQKMREGLNIDEALQLAGKTRLRPILMTSVAMIFGMIPIAFGQSLGHEQRAPMGICVIGGIISSTILTLIIIPCVYKVLQSIKTKITAR